MPLIAGYLLQYHLQDDYRSPPSTVINEQSPTLDKRINVAVTSGSSPGLVAASQEDPFNLAGNYALGWTYFCIILVVATLVRRVYHMWTDKIRRALHKEALSKASTYLTPDSDFEMAQYTNQSINRLFPRDTPSTEKPDTDSMLSVPLVNKTIAFARWMSYRPTPVWQYRIGRRKRAITFPSASVIAVVAAAFAFVMLYTFLPQPYFYQTIAYGSPPLAIRAGMLSVAMVPWIIALSMKASLVSLVTGIGHERLGVLHRWGGYICLALAIIHTVPFYITPVWDEAGLQTFMSYFRGQFYIYGTGIAALAPLGFLCVHSLPIFRSIAYELFVVLHIPASIVFLGMLFWHCNNALTSWSFLWATVGIWSASLLYRLYYLNWSRWWRSSFLCGEEASVILLSENAIKITVPTQLKWNPGQFIYLRIPGISFFENHPFTIASLCSDAFPSDYGDEYRDLTVVFRPFGGFTRKVAEAAERNGPDHTYRAFLDGPYGGMQRELASFDNVVLVAGGSGITAIVSQLLLLIQKMRAGTAVTRQVHVLWALKRPETADWFREELRICRQYAPPDSVHCQFFVTAAKRLQPTIAPSGGSDPQHAAARPNSFLHDRVDAAFQGIASKRNSALIREAAGDDVEKAQELTRETEDDLTALPQVHLKPLGRYSQMTPRKGAPLLTIDTQAAVASNGPPKFALSPTPTNKSAPSSASKATSPPNYQHFATTPTFHPPPRVASKNPSRIVPTMKKGPAVPTKKDAAAFEFGFPETPTALQKNLVRFAFLSGAGGKGGKHTGWETNYGRPDLVYMLREMEKGWGRRAAVMVCGPPTMRQDVKRAVAGLQTKVLQKNSGRDEIFLWGEEYAL